MNNAKLYLTVRQLLSRLFTKLSGSPVDRFYLQNHLFCEISHLGKKKEEYFDDVILKLFTKQEKIILTLLSNCRFTIV